MKTIFYNISKIILLIIGSIIPVTHIHSFDMSNLSPQEMEQMQQFEQELMEASRAIEEAVAQMSPEEQEEFNRAVEEMTKILEEMPDEEFDQFLEDLFTTEFNETMLEELAEQLEEETEEEIQVEQEVVVSLDEFKDIIILLESISKQLNSLLVKISSSPDVPGKLVHWKGQNKIKHWPNQMPWSQLRTAIESFASTLLHMKKVNDKTKKALYLPLIKDNKALVENLTQLNTQLLQVVPGIYIPEFGIEKLSSKTKIDLQKAMNVVTESVFVTNIPAMLEEVEKQFLPEAEKLSKKEEELAKKAQAQTSRPVRTSPTIVAGREQQGYAIPGIPSYDFASDQYRGPGSYGTSGVQPQSPDSQLRRSPSGESKSPAGESKSPETQTESDKKDVDKKKKEEKKELSQQAKDLEDKTANKKLEQALNGIAEVAQIIEQNEYLKKIDEYILKKDDTIIELHLYDLNKTIKNDIIGPLDALDRRLQALPKQQSRALYQKTLKDRALNDFQVIDAFIQKITAINYEKNKNKISKNKRTRFFLDEDALKESPEELEQFKKELPFLVSLDTIQENLIVVLEKRKDLRYKKGFISEDLAPQEITVPEAKEKSEKKILEQELEFRIAIAKEKASQMGMSQVASEKLTIKKQRSDLEEQRDGTEGLLFGWFAKEPESDPEKLNRIALDLRFLTIYEDILEQREIEIQEQLSLLSQERLLIEEQAVKEEEITRQTEDLKIIE